jgi:hypothetical protein
MTRPSIIKEMFMILLMKNKNVDPVEFAQQMSFILDISSETILDEIKDVNINYEKE